MNGLNCWSRPGSPARPRARSISLRGGGLDLHRLTCFLLAPGRLDLESLRGTRRNSPPSGLEPLLRGLAAYRRLGRSLLLAILVAYDGKGTLLACQTLGLATPALTPLAASGAD